mgnify:CR=1 FL=1
MQKHLYHLLIFIVIVFKLGFLLSTFAFKYFKIYDILDKETMEIMEKIRDQFLKEAKRIAVSAYSAKSKKHDYSDIDNAARSQEEWMNSLIKNSLDYLFVISIKENVSGVLRFTKLGENEVEIIASLPCYIGENVDKQRGKNVFQSSIKALRLLNGLGYGFKEKLKLNLVYNPSGPELPPSQVKLKTDYIKFLSERYKVYFNNLYTITNMPIARFGSTLISKNEFNSYMKLLKNSFCEQTVQNVMCKSLISIDYKGFIYDCDFNQMLKIKTQNGSQNVKDLPNIIAGQRISTGDHCYGCTAGSGSSCGGSLL